MNPNAPLLLVRARPKPEAADRFRQWFFRDHLADVRKIPGIVQVEAGWQPNGTAHGFYTFENAESVQPALNSPQAAYARGTWGQVTPELEELAIGVWAPLLPLPVFQAIN